MPTLFSAFLSLILAMTIPDLAQAQGEARGGQPDARARFDRNVTEITRMWDAVRQASPEFSRLFCASPARSSAVCVPDWDGFRSPVGGWRLVDPARCQVDPTPCSTGQRLDPAGLDLTTPRPPPIPPGTVASWLPCDVFPSPGDPGTLQCDDICGCSILKANCAGRWSCSTLPDQCSCSP